MGGCSSASVEEGDKAAAATSKRIDRDNAKDFAASVEKIKILLLGAGESGKSTVFKQMRLLYGQEYADDEKMSYRLFIHQNILETLERLCGAAREAFPQDPVLHSPEFALLAPSTDPKQKQTLKTNDITPEVAAAIKVVWNSDAIQQLWQRRSHLQLIDTVQHFIERVDEVAAFGYLPSSNDIILARIRTTGIREERLRIDNQTFLFVDVGGQRNERRKWIHCFDSVHGVIFVAALSEYDQALFEDNAVNRMCEALDLFGQISGEEVFKNAALILFLNKVDLFQEKVQRVNIKDVPQFSDYSGPPHDVEAGIEYFRNKFLARNTSHHEIFHHVTCATDTSSVRVVFNAVKSVIIRTALERCGFVS